MSVTERQKSMLFGRNLYGEMAKQVVNSPAAIQANINRKQRITDVIKRFGEGIIRVQPNEEEKDTNSPWIDRLKSYQSRCQHWIDQFERDLQSAQAGVITLGYIFDPTILIETAAWFKTNFNRFGGWWTLQSDVLGINGYGKLQYNLSSRDAQAARSCTIM